MLNRREEVRERALRDLQEFDVLMLDGHFDYGNGYHGRVYLNPHQIFCHPATVWRFAQDLIDIVPAALLGQADVVAGPVTGGALLAHTMAGLLEGRRSLSRAPYLFVPFNADPAGGLALRSFYAMRLRARRVLLADDVRNTGRTFRQCAELVRQASGTVLATVQIYDRGEAVVDTGVPNIALAEYRAPANTPADRCPLCAAGIPLTRF